jgi:hypothetical protein
VTTFRAMTAPAVKARTDNDDGEADIDDDEPEAEFSGQDVTGDNPQEPDVDKIAMDFADKQDTNYDGEDEEDSVDVSSKKHKKDQASSDDDDDNSFVKGGEKDTEETQTTAQSTQHPTTTPRELHEQRRNRLTAYYSSGSFYGSPAAYVAYKIASELRFNEVGDLLWLAW